ncbi:MAG: 50S ribosomal protein L30 [Leptospiraceae bacterium]|nr:50S ribosomal protein L30 [Leptospiraceae bacterium]MCP5501957.1 50S ribosomal protein L30 [Leptospiraceae bacterium]
MEEIKITQIKSSIGINPIHKKTLAALGLRKTGSSRVHKMNPQVKGMVNQVKYLLKVEKAG